MLPHGVQKGGGVKVRPHPGARANPYRQRAYGSVRNQVMSEMKNVMGVEVRKILAKANAKTIRDLKAIGRKLIGV